MKKYGPIFKNIRRNKGISQKEVYIGIVSRSFYQKFEKGEYTTSIENFEQFLNRINLSYEEFTFIANDFQLISYDQHLVDIFKAYQDKDYKKLGEIYHLLCSSNIQKEVFLSQIAILLKENISKRKLKEDSLHFIYDYLDDVKDWTFFETKLFNNIMSLIPFDKRKLYFQKFRSFSHRNVDLALINVEISNWQSYIYLNHIQLLLYENRFNDTEKCIESMELDKSEFFTNERNELAFLFLSTLIKLYDPVERKAALEKLEYILKLVKLLNKTNWLLYTQIKEIHEERSKLKFH